jgi:SMODS and SLOG-associating 2TM effector domain 2
MSTDVKPKVPRNIEMRGTDALLWDVTMPEESLERLYQYVIEEAKVSETWYWRRTRPKAWGSLAIQWTAIALTGLAAILPIAFKFLPVPEAAGIPVAPPDSGLLTSLFIGLAASLIGFDRASGMSSGWTRYVLTGTAIRTASEEFRMDWAALRSKLGSPAQPEQIAAMIERAKVFRLAIEGLVAKETREWATEFQANLAQLGNELKVQIDQAQADRAKAEQDLKAAQAKEKSEREAAGQPGSVEVTISNAAAMDAFAFEATLANAREVFATETVSGSQTWALIAVPAGQYRLIVKAHQKSKPLTVMSAITVTARENTKATLTLPAPPPVTQG